jgi:hypothetical protein
LILGTTQGSSANITTAQFANSSTFYVNLAIYSSQAHVNGGTTQVNGFTWRDGTTNIQGGFFLRNGGDFVVTSGNIAGTVLATSGVVAPTASTWYHIQVKIVVHNTAGSVELRVNGSGTNDFTATGLNTRNTTANFYANTLNFVSSSTASDMIDDFYVFNDQGIQPNTWQGDVYATKLMPISDVATTWTRNGGTNNCLAVDDPKQDGNTTYVATDGVNNVDTYAISALATTPESIIAVTLRYMTAIDAAGPHIVNASITSGATTAFIPDYSVTGVYTYQQRVFATDPNTSAPWAAEPVNNLLLNIKCVL